MNRYLENKNNFLKTLEEHLENCFEERTVYGYTWVSPREQL